jgi:hypothetical protein
VTLAALVSPNASIAYPYYFNKALDSGLKPEKLGADAIETRRGFGYLIREEPA